MTRRGRTVTPVDPALVLAMLRLTLGTLFVWVFFENLGKDLYTPQGYAGLIRYYIENGTAPAAWKAVMSFMAGNARIAAPLQAVMEIGIGVLLVLGLLTRLAAAGAFALLTSLWVSEWGTAWIWELLLPMTVALGLGLGGAGRRVGLDALLARRYPDVPLW